MILALERVSFVSVCFATPVRGTFGQGLRLWAYPDVQWTGRGVRAVMVPTQVHTPPASAAMQQSAERGEG